MSAAGRARDLVARPRAGVRPPGRFQRRFPGFRLAPTRAFWVFAATVPLIGLAALNTGNNALYLLLSTALGAFVASGWASRHALAHVSVELVPPLETFAGSAARLTLIARNRSRLLPAAGVVCRLAGLPGSVVLPRIPARGEVRATLTTIFPRRGRRPLPPVRVEVRLPLPFFVKSTMLPQDGELLVFPRLVPGAAPRFVGMSRSEAQTTAGNQRHQGEVEQLREFRPGDDRRDIHWKQTARQQRCIVMERRERSIYSRFLVLDRQVARREEELTLDRFEDLVTEVASAAVDEVRHGRSVGLVVGSAVTLPSTGSRHGRRLLERLALVDVVGPGDDPLPAAFRDGRVYRLVADS